ncbi:MAG: FG-GAP repeat protein [bacterium]
MKAKELAAFGVLIADIAIFHEDNKDWVGSSIGTGPVWKVVPDAGPGESDFGESVAVSRNGRTLLVASPREGCAAGLDCGAAYVYVWEDPVWKQQARLTASDETALAQFGGWELYDNTVALSADGDTALIAAVNGINACSTGSVYVFVRQDGTWSERQKLVLPEDLLLPVVREPDPSCGIEIDQFGRSVALSDNGRTAIVGATLQGLTGGADTGAAYVFQREEDEWMPTARLTGSKTVNESLFKRVRLGAAVALSGNGHTALVGSPATGVTRAEARALSGGYVFKQEGDTWTEVALLHPDPKAANPRNLGGSVALSRNGYTALVGSGRPVVFQGTEDGSWTVEATLGLGLTVSQFGFSLDLNDNGHVAAVGDWGTGKAYAFKRRELDDGTIEWQKLFEIADEQFGFDFGVLGSSVAVSGNAKTVFAGYKPSSEGNEVFSITRE